MNKFFPKINIKYNRFLDPIFIAYIKSNEKWKDWQIPTAREVREKVKAYVVEWKKDEEKILVAIYESTGLFFVRNIIDVHIVSGNPRPFSNPIIIKSGLPPDEFADVLTEELTHVLFSDNKEKLASVNEEIKNLFPNETDLTINHIKTFSLLKYIYIDTLNNPKKLERQRQGDKNHSTDEYVKAWEIIDKLGYKTLINKIKK